MKADFAGQTARLYAHYRRDLPSAQTHALIEEMGIRTDDKIIDLGCGTGQLGVPLSAYCSGVVAVDPEPQMLAGLRARETEGIVCVLADDGELPLLGATLAGPVGAVVVGNALHWMDEPSALRASVDLIRPGGAVAVITQGPPLWLGPAPWQMAVRQALEEVLGPVSATCGTDTETLDERVRILERLGMDVHVATWCASHQVDPDWVIGHLGSATSADTPYDTDGGLRDVLQPTLDQHHTADMIERVTTTAVIAHRPI